MPRSDEPYWLRESSPRGAAGTTILRFGADRVLAVPYRDFEGMAVFQGDIILGTLAQARADASVAAAAKLQLGRRPLLLPDDLKTVDLFGLRLRDPAAFWPTGRIPYVVDGSVLYPEDVYDAMREWEAVTPIRFEMRRDDDVDHIVIVGGANGSSAPIGRLDGAQTVFLKDTVTKWNIAHELGHVIGLWHEHCRSDRDAYVTVISANVDPAEEDEFRQEIVLAENRGPYDYDSIMHYSADAYPRKDGLITIQSPKPIGQRDHLSAGDIATVKAMYGTA